MLTSSIGLFISRLAFWELMLESKKKFNTCKSAKKKPFGFDYGT
jgi:hypothetical protein